MMRRLILVLIISATLVLSASSAIATEPKPLDCVADATNLTLYQWDYWGQHYDPVEIYSWQWNELLAIDGDSIWVGYENGGWDVPSDVIGIWKITGTQNDEPIEIWIWRTRVERPYRYFVFPFANTELYADKNGEHFGQHPCGGWEIESAPLLNFVSRVMDNRDWEDY